IPICKNLYHFLLCHSSDTITTYIYTLSLHDALPILPVSRYIKYDVTFESGLTLCVSKKFLPYPNSIHFLLRNWNREDACEYGFRSEEHTSELQSRFDLVCRLLLEKKKNIKLKTLYFK